MMLTPNVDIEVIDEYDSNRYTVVNPSCFGMDELKDGLPFVRTHHSTLNGSHNGVHLMFQEIIYALQRGGYGHCEYNNHSIYP